MLTENLRRNIFGDAETTVEEIDAAIESRSDHYFTQKDLIVRVNSEKERVQVWSVRPDYDH